MPHRFPFQQQVRSEDEIFHFPEGMAQEMDDQQRSQQNKTSPKKIKRALKDLFRRHEWHQSQQIAPVESIPEHFPPPRRRIAQPEPTAATTASARKPIPSIPRPQTVARQDSERRDRLEVVPPSPLQRRPISVDRWRGGSERPARRRSLQAHVFTGSSSAPQVSTPATTSQASSPGGRGEVGEWLKQSLDNYDNVGDTGFLQDDDDHDDHNRDEGDGGNEESSDCDLDDAALQELYDRCWILNLSMHFRDKSNREKFFVTYAEPSTRWRRITISLDYRNAPPGSLEEELSTLRYQSDKSLHIFRAIRESLPDVEYFPTVTNLKLETTPEDGQLHIRVREDANEIVQYPTLTSVEHVQCPRVPESQVKFDSHLSGFVYKVHVRDEILIKKEIPGPDTIDEFLYEVNALDTLLKEGSKSIVELKGLVTDDASTVVKGLLIAYASKGALVDMLYEHQHPEPEHGLPWHRREKWAKQIVQGLSDIHEAGFVQGDFTLSNIVIRSNDDAQIIDINRRGCPVGWEPPEFNRLIDSRQRIGMCIGVKSDLFQLGMVLWALAEEVDEPEHVMRPLPDVVDTVPEYFRDIVKICLSERPQSRVNARVLLGRFPATAGQPDIENGSNEQQLPDQSLSTSHRSDKEYIDPALAVTIEEIDEQRRQRSNTDASHFTSGAVTYVEPDSREQSDSYRNESFGSWIVNRGRRGRSPVSSARNVERQSSPYDRPTPSPSTSVSSMSSYKKPRSERKYVMSDSADASRPNTSNRDTPTPEHALSNDDSNPTQMAATRAESQTGSWAKQGDHISIPLPPPPPPPTSVVS